MRRNPIVPILLLFALMTFVNLMRGQDLGEFLIEKLIILPGIIIGLSFHEFGHALASTKLGDPTPEKQGRVTLNPIAHIDPVGMLCLIFAGFGWGVPVQIDPTYYKDRRAGEILVGFAGVAMNLLLAVVFSLLTRLYLTVAGNAQDDVNMIVEQVLFGVIYINVILLVFNLLPIPPLDGFGIVTQIFDLERKPWYRTVYSYGYFILIFAVLLGLVGMVLTPLTRLLVNFLCTTLVGIPPVIA